MAPVQPSTPQPPPLIPVCKISRRNARLRTAFAVRSASAARQCQLGANKFTEVLFLHGHHSLRRHRTRDPRPAAFAPETQSSRPMHALQGPPDTGNPTLRPHIAACGPVTWGWEAEPGTRSAPRTNGRKDHSTHNALWPRPPPIGETGRSRLWPRPPRRALGPQH